MKLKGGILYYTLLLMIISTAVMSLLIMRGYLFNKFFINSIQRDKLERNVSSAFNIYREGDMDFSVSENFDIDLFGDGLDIVSVEKKKWGVYDLITINAEWKNFKVKKSGLFGTDMDRGNGTAVYLVDNGISLSLSGSSFVKGLCFTSEGFVSSASIEGYPFIFQKTVEGRVEKSAKPPLFLDTEVPASITSLFYELSNYVPFSDIKSNNISAIENSFCEPVSVYYADSSLVLSGISLKNNIILASNGTLTINKSAELENVILLARKIVVNEGYSGSFQAFALEKIDVRKNVFLEYPSVLAIVHDSLRKFTQMPAIFLEENTSVSGGIFVIANDDTGFIKISKNSTIYGQVYCNGNIEHSGNVYGSVYCNMFSYIFGQMRYYNHLLNANIDYSKLPYNFSGVNINNENPKKSLIKWVD